MCNDATIGKNRHICIVTQQIGQVVSGVGLYARNLALRLAADGHRVCVVAPHGQRPPGDLPYQFVGIAPPRFQASQARWLSLSASFARTLRKLERQHRFDIIHFTDAREALFCRSSTPLIGTIHDTYAAELRGPGYYRRYYNDWPIRWAYYCFVRTCEGRTFPRLRALLANSHHTAQAVLEHYAVSDKQLSTCYLGIDAEPYMPSYQRRVAGNTAHPPRILFVGGNMQRKGLPTLIRAAPRVLATLPQAEFWVVGQDAAAQRMQAACRLEGVDRHFRFWGGRSQDELRELYAQADVFAMPSLVEAFGLVFLEAMAAGVAVLGTRVGGIPEIIEDGHNGLLVEPDDPTGLAAALIRMLQDQALRDRLQRAGLETARRFSLDQMMRCNDQVYQRLLQ